MISAKIEITDEIIQAIDKVLSKALQKEYDIMLEKFKEKKAELTARVLLDVKKTMDIRTVGEKITFTIDAIN